MYRLQLKIHLLNSVKVNIFMTQISTKRKDWRDKRKKRQVGGGGCSKSWATTGRRDYEKWSWESGCKYLQKTFHDTQYNLDGKDNYIFTTCPGQKYLHKRFWGKIRFLWNVFVKVKRNEINRKQILRGPKDIV